MCSCLSCGPHWGPGPQPRHVPRVGIELETLWFTAHSQSTELHHPGLIFVFLKKSPPKDMYIDFREREGCIWPVIRIIVSIWHNEYT